MMKIRFSATDFAAKTQQIPSESEGEPACVALCAARVSLCVTNDTRCENLEQLVTVQIWKSQHTLQTSDFCPLHVNGVFENWTIEDFLCRIRIENLQQIRQVWTWPNGAQVYEGFSGFIKLH